MANIYKEKDKVHDIAKFLKAHDNLLLLLVKDLMKFESPRGVQYCKHSKHIFHLSIEFSQKIKLFNKEGYFGNYGKGAN